MVAVTDEPSLSYYTAAFATVAEAISPTAITELLLVVVAAVLTFASSARLLMHTVHYELTENTAEIAPTLL